jgi:protein-tyrosine phosphatase
MAAGLLRRRLEELGIDAEVSSAGEMAGGVPAAGGSVRALASRGIDLTGHRSRRFTADHLASADLVLGMARRHVREAVLACPDAWPRTFTLKELVRRGRSMGPRRPGQSLEEWLRRAHLGRRPADMLGDETDDDVADPIGGPDHRYTTTAAELDELIGELVGLAFAPAAPSVGMATTREG